jgi:hypothetical protein
MSTHSPSAPAPTSGWERLARKLGLTLLTLGFNVIRQIRSPALKLIGVLAFVGQLAAWGYLFFWTYLVFEHALHPPTGGAPAEALPVPPLYAFGVVLAWFLVVIATALIHDLAGAARPITGGPPALSSSSAGSVKVRRELEDAINRARARLEIVGLMVQSADVAPPLKKAVKAQLTEAKKNLTIALNRSLRMGAS